jgi:hypothetical protein
VIIFSYLGSDIPEYAFINAVNTQRRFPSIDVGMIVSTQNNARRIEKLGLQPFVYETNVNDFLFSEMSTERKNFRHGFWRYTLERLFSLESCFSQGENSIVHVESDVILLNGFEKINFQELKTSWLKHKSNEDSAAVVHISSKNDFELLNMDLRRNLRLNPNLSEMQILSKLRTQGKTKFGFLPSIFSDGKVIVDSQAEKNELVFDPAVLGMWLFGHDPRNHFGFTKKFILAGEKQAEAFDLQIAVENDKPIVYLGSDINVVSLHVHTKKEKIFQDPYESIRIQLNSNRKLTDFSPSIFFEVYKEFAKRKKRKAFLASVLGLYKPINFVRKKISDFGG